MDEKCPVCGGEGSRVWIPSYLRSAVFSFQCSACGYLEKPTIMRRVKDGLTFWWIKEKFKWERLKRDRKCKYCGDILAGPDMDTGIRFLRLKSDQGWWRIAGFWCCPSCIDGHAVEQWIEANRQYEKQVRRHKWHWTPHSDCFLCKAGKEPKDTPLQGG